MKKDSSPFSLKGKVVVITGGGGLLGRQHAQAVAHHGAVPVIVDFDARRAEGAAKALETRYGTAVAMSADITQEEQVEDCADRLLKRFGHIDVLINNAARNPQVTAAGGMSHSSRLESFPLEDWKADIAVGLTGAFLCAKYFGRAIADNPGGGSIINISSDLGIIAPDQRLYRKKGVPAPKQAVKPVTYSVVKTGLIGLTRYLATYWAERGVRANALCPGGVENGQDPEFVRRVEDLIPLKRMARADDYQGAIVFLASDASRYMNGAVLVIDGGRSCW
mgnify:CR=1 FL=1